MKIPLYVFVRGDAAVMLVLADPADKVALLAYDVQTAAAVRLPPAKHARVFLGERELDLDLSIDEAGITALARVDIVRGEET